MAYRSSLFDFPGAQFRRRGPVVVPPVSIGYGFGPFSEKVIYDASSGLGVGRWSCSSALSWMLSKKLERVAERAT